MKNEILLEILNREKRLSFISHSVALLEIGIFFFARPISRPSRTHLSCISLAVSPASAASSNPPRLHLLPLLLLLEWSSITATTFQQWRPCSSCLLLLSCCFCLFLKRGSRKSLAGISTAGDARLWSGLERPERPRRLGAIWKRKWGCHWQVMARVMSSFWGTNSRLKFVSKLCAKDNLGEWEIYQEETAKPLHSAKIGTATLERSGGSKKGTILRSFGAGYCRKLRIN